MFFSVRFSIEGLQFIVEHFPSFIHAKHIQKTSFRQISASTLHSKVSNVRNNGREETVHLKVYVYGREVSCVCGEGFAYQTDLVEAALQ